MLSVRVVTVDHYMSKQVKELYDGSKRREEKHWYEPVVRIFGSTPDGVKTCIHIHGVYPYVYVPYKGGENPARDALLLGAALDQSLATALNSNSTKFVYKIVLVSGIPLYGYHSSPRQFFKIYFLNPYHIRKASELLLRGVILGEKFQPHEAHIPYTLQFMIDYNIYGMSFINIEKVKYRRSPSNPGFLKGIETNLILPSSVKKRTYSYWEVDALAEDIINNRRSSTGEAVSVNPGLEAIWEDERNRRRAQSRPSQITPQISEPRPEFKPTSNELMHRQRLSRKLKDVVVEVPSETLAVPLSYPGEVPASAEMIDASVVGAAEIEFSSEDLLENVSDLIDEKILMEMMGNQDGGSESEEERGREDSILGRNQRDEEEAELEDEDGGDMTQPLEMLENVITSDYHANREELGGIDGDSEEQFWKEMADKIMQLDGTDDLSSMDSDEENRRSIVTVHPDLLTRAEDTVDRALENNSPGNESMSNWSNNIMSILNENPGPQLVYPNSQGFWYNWSPKMNESLWPTQNTSDSWAWDRNDSNLLECLSYSVRKTGKNEVAADKSFESHTPSETVNSIELYGFPTAQGDYLQGNYTPTTTMSPISNVGSTYNISPPSAILTPSSEMDSYSDVNLDSVSQVSNSPSPQDDPKSTELCARTQIIESKTVTLPRVEMKKSKIAPDHKELMDILKNISETSKNMEKADGKAKMVALILKQYIKACGEIVSVDFKNLSGKEMIVVEYKPLNSKSNQNKYLIKPLDKFLDDWCSTEEKYNNSGAPAENPQGEWPRLINGFLNSEKSMEEEKQLNAILRTLENKYTGNWLDESKIKTIKNRFVVKSMEMLPDNCERVPEKMVKSDVERSYKINENVDSNGKIKMKLIKDRKARKLENAEITSAKKFSPSEPNNTKTIPKKKGNKDDLNKVNKLSFLDCGKSSSKEKRAKTNEEDKEESPVSDDKRLIDQINQSFEDYFKNIVKVNAWSSRNEAVADEEEESTSGEEGNEEPDQESDTEQKSTETIKFITQLLSALMSLSRSSALPPLSVTINFGNGRLFPSLHFNLRSRKSTSHKRKSSKKLKVNNFDGPADDTSSSEESVEENPPVKTTTKKKAKKDLAYRPLNVVVQKIPAADVSGRKRKLPSARNLDEEPDRSGSPSSNVYCLRSGIRTSRRCAATSKDRQQENKGTGHGSNTEQKVEAENLTEFRKAPRGCEQFPRFDKALMENEMDYIEDSEEESGIGERKKRKFKRILEKAKKKRVESPTVPQMDIVTSSDGEDTRSPKMGNEGEGNEEKGTASFCEEQSESLNKVQEVLPKVILCCKTPEEIDLMEITQNSRSPPEKPSTQASSESTPLSTSIFSLSYDSYPLSKEPANLAVNSDDSLEKFEISEQDRTVTPFELSGSILHGNENSPSNTQLSGISPLEKMLGEMQKSPSNTPSSEGILTVTALMTITPKRNPPSFDEVRATMNDYDIQETVAQVPYYSDPKDITKAVEIGQRVLKIENYSVATLKSHVSEIDLLGTETRRNLALNIEIKGSRSIRSVLVGKREICITPLSKPPTRGEACKWSQENFERNEMEEKVKAKVRMPKSPGQDSESDDEMDLSVVLTSEKEESMKNTSEEACVAGPSGMKRTFCNSSSSSSPCSFPEDVKHSTPFEPKSDSPDLLGLKKGPLHRIKGVKRLSLLKKLETIAEEQQLPAAVIVNESVKAEEQEQEKKTSSNSSFGIQGMTLENTYGFKNSVEHLRDAKTLQTPEYITMLVMELHVQTRGSLRPDPQYDPICAVFYTLTTDGVERVEETGMIAVGEEAMVGTATSIENIHYVPEEKALLDKLIEFLRMWDPDILAGYEIEMNSWGYLFQRSFVLEKNLYSLASRVVDENQNWKELLKEDPEGDDIPKYLRPLRVTGRIVLDVWRLLRHEVALTSYTFENVMYHLLHERHPNHSYRALSQFWDHPTRMYRHITAEYYSTRTRGIVRLLDSLDFISRNSELARLFGIQFYEVLSRGSQFRVESMMLRLAKPSNYVPCSPSISQRAAMRAPASLPLIMEPESSFYVDPVIVLDFQSLYPSVIIAYNYCFSTCLGRVELLGGRGPFEFGCTELQISPEEVKNLEKDINISPAGIAFVRPNIRKGVLPSMLEEILETRLMVKKSMKENKGNKLLQKVLHARQLGLKLIANVTYGYTAANFSGRMPCIEVGDSVVSKGRETLQRAIEMVKNTPKWGAKVVYGDTDSLFVSTPGKSRKEAFEIGNEIAEAVTRDNPKPVKLKLEKVYQPCILQTKKRYVGHMYESWDQEKPIYDAKGIETVRRDGCPATAKILQKALEILFETKDVSQVKRYTIRQFAKLFQGRVNIQDLIFAKEYRGRRGYRPGACVPALELAKRWTQTDKRAEPRKKERVPYVIVNGPPGLPLIRLVRSPRDLFLDPSLRINAAYYITKAIIPPMQRCFSLLGADVVLWYAEMPRKYERMVKRNQKTEGRRNTISQYFARVECLACSEITNDPVCARCREDPQKVAVIVYERIRRLDRSHHCISKICESCCKRTHSTDCESLDCPVLYRRHQALRDLDQADALRETFRDYSLGLLQTEAEQGVRKDENRDRKS